MDSQQTPAQVLIIGAGLAGLALAQGLKKADPPIPFHIFERDNSASFRAQGYRIRIAPEEAGLKDVVPADVWEACMATAADVAGGRGGGSRVQAFTCEPSEFMKGQGPPPPVGSSATRTVNVDRTIIRNVLIRGLEDYISFGKRFESYAAAADGSGGVEVRFQDGSTASGCLLVGADGIRSSVRRQLLPGMTVLDTEGRAVYGKTFLTPELEKLLLPQITQAICVVQEEQGSPHRLLTDVMRFDPELDAAERARYGVPGDYIYWALVFREDLLGLRSDDSSKSVLPSQHALDITGAWHKSIRAVVENQALEASTMVSFWCCDKDTFATNWEGVGKSTPVTLIGDAGHPVPPVGAMGLHLAFSDAAGLYEALTGLPQGSGPGERLEAVRTSEKSMQERAKVTMERALIGAKNFFGMKPIDELKPASL